MSNFVKKNRNILLRFENCTSEFGGSRGSFPEPSVSVRSCSTLAFTVRDIDLLLRMALTQSALYAI